MKVHLSTAVLKCGRHNRQRRRSTTVANDETVRSAPDRYDKPPLKLHYRAPIERLALLLFGHQLNSNTRSVCSIFLFDSESCVYNAGATRRRPSGWLVYLRRRMCKPATINAAAAAAYQLQQPGRADYPPLSGSQCTQCIGVCSATLDTGLNCDEDGGIEACLMITDILSRNHIL